MSFRTAGSFALVACTLILSACTGFGGPVQGEISEEERRLRNIESRVDEAHRRVESLSETLLAQQQGPGSVSEELRQLRGEVEQLRHDLDRSSRSARQLYQDLDRRLIALEGGTPPDPDRRANRVSGSTDVAIVGSGLPEPGERPAQTRDPAEETAYMEAFDLLKAGSYQDAVLGFENVVTNWPNGRYTDAALYWSGESHYVLRNYQDALQQFGKLIEEHPGSSRVPDALLKSGFAHEELGQSDRARSAFERIVQEHGDSSAASLAQQRLQRLN